MEFDSTFWVAVSFFIFFKLIKILRRKEKIIEIFLKN